LRRQDPETFKDQDSSRTRSLKVGRGIDRGWVNTNRRRKRGDILERSSQESPSYFLVSSISVQIEGLSNSRRKKSRKTFHQHLGKKR